MKSAAGKRPPDEENFCTAPNYKSQHLRSAECGSPPTERHREVQHAFSALERSCQNGVPPPPAVMLSCHGIRQTLEGSFSAVSKPNFASKYAFESSRRDLHNALLCTALQSHFFVKILPKTLQNSAKFLKFFANFWKIQNSTTFLKRM